MTVLASEGYCENCFIPSLSRQIRGAGNTCTSAQDKAPAFMEATSTGEKQTAMRNQGVVTARKKNKIPGLSDTDRGWWFCFVFSSKGF